MEWPENTSWFELDAVAIFCGIGFTMRLFLGTLAFDESHPMYWVDVRVGVLLGPVLWGVMGARVLQRALLKKKQAERGMGWMEDNGMVVGWQRRCLGWLIHAFTASGAFVGLMALAAIHEQKLLTALWLMALAILIDSVDGMFARRVKIKLAVPKIDGALLDNIVDFFTYTMVPCFFLLVTPLLPDHWRLLCVIAITFSSAYQFTQLDAKTSDHFFKGFPSYWNIVVFYMFFWQLSEWTNVAILLFLAVLSFVPIKYVYPSRLEYLTHNPVLRFGMLLATVLWGAATAKLLWDYPQSNMAMSFVSMGYMVLYVGISLYRTWVPLTTLAEPIKLKTAKPKSPPVGAKKRARSR